MRRRHHGCRRTLGEESPEVSKRALYIGCIVCQAGLGPPVRFRRTSGLLALPVPVRGGSLERLREGRYVNVKDDASWRLLIGFLLRAK